MPVMASLRTRNRKDGTTYHAVLYRHGGKQTSTSFEDVDAAANEGRIRRPQMRCSLHNTELTATGECDECAKLITPPKKPHSRRKPWWQFW